MPIKLVFCHLPFHRFAGLQYGSGVFDWLAQQFYVAQLRDPPNKSCLGPFDICVSSGDSHLQSDYHLLWSQTAVDKANLTQGSRNVT